MGTVFFLQDLGLVLRMHLSVSSCPWDIDLPRGQYFLGVTERHISPRPRVPELHSTQMQLELKGCFSSSGVLFLPTTLQGLVPVLSFLWALTILIIPTSAPETPMLLLSFSRQTACSGQLLGELCMGGVCAGTNWEGSQYCRGSHSVVVWHWLSLLLL